MIRSAIGTAVCLAFALGLAAPAMAQSSKAKKCDAFGEITQAIAELRKQGTEETAAILAMGEQYKDQSTDVLQVIPYLSSFVYSLDDADLGGDVGGAMAQQCKAA